jgi:hypothetical protein
VSTAQITVKMLADNTASAFLNGVTVGGLAFHLEPTNHQNFNTIGGEGPFGPNIGAAGGFKAGLNTLQFVVLDESRECTGLDFSATIKAPRCTSGEPPEFPGVGRCIKVVTKGTGSYKDAGCETAEVENGNYEWLPGAVKNKFTSTEGASFFEGKSGQKITCKASTDTGEYNGESEDHETMRFTGCETAGFKCNSAGAAEGEIVTTLLKSVPGFIKRPKTVGVSLEGPSGIFAEFECAGGAVKIVMRGSVISSITPVSKMTTTFKETFAEIKGVQKYQKCEGEPTDILETSENGGPFEQTGFSSIDTITNEEPLEMREAP